MNSVFLLLNWWLKNLDYPTFYSSNWGQKSKTRVTYWWSWISLFAHVFSVKCTRSPTIQSSTCRHSPTYNLQRENWNKTNALVNVTKNETRHEIDDLNPINSREFTCLPLFALLVTHKEKTSVSHASQFEKDRIRASRCSGRKFLCTFHPEATGVGGKVQSKNANSYIYTTIYILV